MGPEIIEEFGVALHGEESLRSWINQNAVAMQNVTRTQIREAFGGLIGQADKGVLVGDFAEDMANEMRRALSHGFDGWIDDDDFMVPGIHSRWLASKIPASHLNFIPKNGHISLIVKHRDQIVIQLQQLIG